MKREDSIPPAASSSHAVAGAGWALALLLAINLFNYIDRQVLSATLPKIRLDPTMLRPDDPWAQTKLGALTTAFMAAYMLFSPLFGRLGDRWSRWGIVGGAVIVWSLATGGSGLAMGYAMLLATRCLVGIGEAAYGPVAPAMLSDLYPVERRGQILAWFYMAIPVGSALGFVIGAQVAEVAGWRWAFLVVVLPGILLGILCFFMQEPPRPSTPQAPAQEPASSHSYWDVLRELGRIRSFVLCSAGMTVSTFVLGGVATVMQLYLFEREARFTITPEVLAKLAALRTADGTEIVPPAVRERLAQLPAGQSWQAAELRQLLQEKLTPQEYLLYSTWIFDAATAPGSWTNGLIGLYIGGLVVVGGLIATLAGGLAGDYLRNRGVKGAYFWVAGGGMIVGFPAFVALLYTPLPWGWVFFFIAVFFLFFNTGPANAILANVARSPIRATAFAINIFVIHAFGDAISPLIIGVIADLSSLQTAFLFVAFLIPVSGVLWLWGRHYLDADTQRAEAGLQPGDEPH
jgi:MFS family permease